MRHRRAGCITGIEVIDDFARVVQGMIGFPIGNEHQFVDVGSGEGAARRFDPLVRFNQSGLIVGVLGVVDGDAIHGRNCICELRAVIQTICREIECADCAGAGAELHDVNTNVLCAGIRKVFECLDGCLL